MEWLLDFAYFIAEWLQFLVNNPESVLLSAMAVFLGLALSTGFAFATDPEEPRGIRITGVLILVCCIGALSCTAMGMLAS